MSGCEWDCGCSRSTRRRGQVPKRIAIFNCWLEQGCQWNTQKFEHIRAATPYLTQTEHAQWVDMSEM